MTMLNDHDKGIPIFLQRLNPTWHIDLLERLLNSGLVRTKLLQLVFRHLHAICQYVAD